VTAAAMFTLAAGKARTGRALNNPVLRTEGRVTMIDGVLAVAVLLGLTLNAGLGWWWADPVAGYVLVYYATREVREIFWPRSGLPARRRDPLQDREQEPDTRLKLSGGPLEGRVAG
jgi:divalent metal cation (Fe/Co/Zn/Cd) transporter